MGSTEDFPVGGPRQAVFDALTQRQFTMTKGLGDKQWERADGYRAHVYGAGSKLQLTRDRKIIADGPMAEVLAKLDGLTK
jgi:hypothetical protein